MAEAPPNGGGYVRWVDLREHERAESRARHDLRGDANSAHAALRLELMDALRDQERRMAAHELRTDKLESVIDQLKGATRLAWAILGTSIVSGLVSLAALVAIVRG